MLNRHMEDNNVILVAAVKVTSLLSFQTLCVSQIPISYWLTNRYTYKHEEDFYLFDTLIGEEISSYSHPLKTDNCKSAIIPSRLKYTIVGLLFFSAA